MKRICVLLAIGFCLPIFSSVGAQEQTVGLFLNDPASFDGYTLFAPKHYTATYLIDNQGRLVHSWEESDYEPGQSVYLLENGDLLRACFIKEAGLTGGGEGGRIEEYDWDGNVMWEFDYYSDDYVSHHDIEPLPNGNILALAVERKTREQAIAAGFNPSYLAEGYLLPDYVVEIEKTGSEGGNIVWEWHVWDHLIQDYDPARANYGVVGDHPELVDANLSGQSTHYFWNHMNSIDYDENFDQIMLSVRGNDEIWVIDHSTTTAEAAGHTGGTSGKGGDILYRWGNPEAYGAGNASDQRLFQQHDAQWIESGCPGEGDILVFNNGLKRPEGEYSSVDEIVPPVDNDGNYSLTPGAAYEPEEQIWIYTAENPTDLYSEAISGAHRLPNGNTLICDGTHGIFLEVTSEKETVWKYVNPVAETGPLTQGDTAGLDHRGHKYNAVFKIHRYSPDYPGLAGHDLTPGDPIELPLTGVDDQASEVPRRFELFQNYPNPFNPSTSIGFTLPTSADVDLSVYNLLGQRVKTLFRGTQTAGHHEITWDGTDENGRGVASSIYLYMFLVGDQRTVRKMCLMR